MRLPFDICVCVRICGASGALGDTGGRAERPRDVYSEYMRVPDDDRAATSERPPRCVKGNRYRVIELEPRVVYYMCVCECVCECVCLRRGVAASSRATAAANGSDALEHIKTCVCVCVLYIIHYICTRTRAHQRIDGWSTR